jgi:hypothetical protein
MILTEQRLHFAKEGDHWRCVEHPDLVMLRGERYRARFAFFTRLLAVAQEVAKKRGQ